MTVDWAQTELVIFDVDGTMYSQSGLRRRMALELAAFALWKRDFTTPLILHRFRKVREALAKQGSRNFAIEQYALTARACNCSSERVREVVAAWIEERPLVHLKKHRVPGIDLVFDALRRQRRRIAVLSDYPAREKLIALGLSADMTVSADQPDVSALKPNPAGIEKILNQTDVRPASALMIGDRFETDWKAAQAAGVPCLIRSRKPDPRAYTFRDYHDSCFRQLTGKGL